MLLGVGSRATVTDRTDHTLPRDFFVETAVPRCTTPQWGWCGLQAGRRFLNIIIFFMSLFNFLL